MSHCYACGWVFSIICFSSVLLLSEDKVSNIVALIFTHEASHWDCTQQLGWARQSARLQPKQLPLKPKAGAAS